MLMLMRKLRMDRTVVVALLVLGIAASGSTAEAQREAPRRAAERRDLRHALGGEGLDRALAAGVQRDSTAPVAWQKTASA
jgi:hypothetical protein